jgi:uncharacterized protein involved in exopolysaccharide biosynthesis/Mrp family chromosome partitioning ATPase
MTEKPANVPAPVLSLADVYYTLFRHKWKVLLISAAGTLAALLLPLVRQLPYQSEAKLLIRYVLESRTPSQIGGPDSRVKSPDERGENIINTELEILTSLDLAAEVVTNIGADRILAKAGGGNDPQKAAALVRKNVTAEVPKKSNVIRIVFQHRDPTIVQEVLTRLIESYRDRHVQIHHATGVSDDFLTRKIDELRTSLSSTERALRSAKTNAGVLSLEDSKKVFTDQLSKIQQGIFDAEAELAERQAALGEMNKALRPDASAARANASVTSPNQVAATNTPAGTNAVAITPASTQQPTNLPMPASALIGGSGQQSSNPATAGSALTLVPGRGNGQQSSNVEVADSALTPTLSPGRGIEQSTNLAEVPVPSAKVAEYKRLSGLLDSLGKSQEELLRSFTPESSRVKAILAQIADAEAQKQQLEAENPGLLAVKVTETKATDQSSGSHFDFAAETARVSGLESKIRALNVQLAKITKQASTVEEMEGPIVELQRQKELEEANLKTFSTSLEQSRIDVALGPGLVSNISTVQAPSPPFREDAKLQKLRAMLLFGGLAAAVGLAFIIELYLDRSLKRPIEIETRIGLPLFISIPLMNRNGNGNGNGKPHFLKNFRKLPLLPDRTREHTEASHPVAEPHSPEQTAEALAAPQPDEAEPTVVPPPAVPSVLRPFYETLRDRLITFFEVRNLTHKPKLVAVTSCGDGAGVTTTAAGLAAGLSETGDGNVLLVDMNVQQGEAHHFYKGRLNIGLDDALENGKRDEALVQEKLYVVAETANDDKLPRVLPKRFKHLVPKLKASDYDYIIFDMPPISQISATPRLASFMDMVFVVVESEKTDRDVLKRATALLAESKCNLGVILNKSRSYVPKQLQQEL